MKTNVSVTFELSLADITSINTAIQTMCKVKDALEASEIHRTSEKGSLSSIVKLNAAIKVLNDVLDGKAL